MDSLASKVRFGSGGIDQEQIARAEADRAALAVEYLAWAAADLQKMRALAERLADRAAIERLYAVAHDVKGQGGSFGYPLMTAIADSLCRLLKLVQDADAARPAIAAHLDAMAQVLGERWAGGQGTRGEALLLRLASMVDSLDIASKSQ